MIRIDRGLEVRPGVWAYCIPSLDLEGVSRQPLLDACRQICAILGDTWETAVIFREGRSEPDMTCDVAKAAMLTVKDGGTNSPHFAKWSPFVKWA